MRMKRLLVGVTALAMTGLALAAGPGAVRKRVEASMLLTGSITVAPDGSVSSYDIDKADKVPAEIVSLVQQSATDWRFEPVIRDGHPVSAKAHMSLRVVARRENENSESMTARIAGANFGDDGQDGESITYIDRHPPSYPAGAAAAHVEGTVYLLLRVDHDGKVADAFPEQVNMGVIGSDADLRIWRKALADPSVLAAKTWTFRPPTKGPHANDPYYDVRVPIVFAINSRKGGGPGDMYGQWKAYVPGPKETAPWSSDTSKGDANTDALPDGQLFLVNGGLKLKTPLDHS
jgi:hypothetical protein